MERGPKGLAISIVSKMKKPDSMEASDFVDKGDMEKEAYDDGFGIAADEVMMALKSGNKKLFRDALRSAIQMCDHESEDDYED
jgi:hypothetical protein